MLFEWVTTSEVQLENDLVDMLAPFITADPQQMYCDLAQEPAQDYMLLKVEILARLGGHLQLV